MRSDFGLYAVAIIFFVIAALPYEVPVSIELLRLEYPMNLTLTVIFVTLGLISIILGYSKRPKPVIFVPETPKPTQPLQKTSEPVREEPTLTPSVSSVEAEKLKREKRSTKTRRKTRRKRKKA